MLGHGGLLGHVVVRVMQEAGFEVYAASARYRGAALDPLVEAVLRVEPHAVINCARAGDEAPRSRELMQVNALLPLHMAAVLPSDCLFVHASSDAVAPGRPAKGWAEREDEAPYTLSKRLAECCLQLARAVILRCSVIGPEMGVPQSLMGKAIQSDEVTGYIDHVWNGITSLTWARLAAKAVRGRLPPGVHQPACEVPVTKAELLKSIATVYGRPANVHFMTSGCPVDRRLVPTLLTPPIEDQLRELRRWYGTLPEGVEIHLV